MSDWPSEAADPTLLLAGVRVLDLSRVFAGPFATMVLGDLGADVIKVERPGDGDETRRWGPPFRDGDATYFYAVNRNRRSVTLDVTTASGSAVVGRLAAAADVVVENFLPAQLRTLGLDRVRDDSIDTVWVSIRAAAAGGPLENMPGYDAMIQGRAGLMGVTGDPECGPVKVGIPVVALIAGLYAAIGALSALLSEARVTGRPAARVEVPLLECGVSALSHQAASYLLGGVTPQLLGSEHPNIAPYGPVPTADGQVLVGAATNRQFAALCGAAGLEGLIDDPRFVSNAARVQHRAQLDAILADRFRTAAARTWHDALVAADVPCAPINTVEQVFAEPQVRASGIVQEVHDRGGPMQLVASPITIDGRRPPIRRPPPRLGEHTDDILAALGEELE